MTRRRIPATGLLWTALLAGCLSAPSGEDDAPSDGEVELTVGCVAAAPDQETAATFCLSVDEGIAPLVLRTATSGTDGTVTWDFGDSSSAGTDESVHVYPRPGVYTVAVRMTRADGRQDQGSRQITVLPATSRIAGPALCRVGQSLSLSLTDPPPFPCSWSARDGRISGTAEGAVYVAPEIPGRDLVRAVFDVHGVPFEVTTEVLAYRQFVILKADDLGIRTPRWERYFELLDRAGLAGTAGVIWSQLRKASSSWVRELLDLQAAGRCEFFHHGWDHASGENLDGTAPGIATWEFRGTGYEYQRRHLTAGLAVADSLGFRVATFGPPFNKADRTTVRVLDETPAIRSVLFEPPGGNRIRFSRVVDIENGTGKPDRSFFEAQYRAHEEEEYLVLQVHPNAIEAARFPELERILSLLVAEGRTFVTAEEYRRLDATRRSGSPRVAAREAAGGP